MKRLFTVITLALLTLAGCSSSDEEITISVAGWGFGADGTEAADNSINRQIVAKYEEENPNVTIDIISPPEGEYEETVNSMIAGGDAPDAFLYNSNTTPLTQGWALDLSEYTAGNDVYESFIPALKNGGIVDGKVYGVPTSLGFQGIYQNLDILNEQNVDPLTAGYTMNDLVENIKATTTETVLGFDAFSPSIDWSPAIEDTNLEWYNYNGETYDYNNEAFVNAIDRSAELCEGNYTFECMPEDFILEGDWAVASGQVAYFQTQANWDVAGDTGQNFELIGMPSDTTIVIPDYMYVSESTDYPEETLDFILYYGAESFQQRIEFAKTNDSFVNTAPLTDNSDDAQSFKDYMTDKGYPLLATMYDNAINDNNVLLEPLKGTPGYSEVRFNAATGVTNEETGEEYTTGTMVTDIAKGKLKLSDYADDLNQTSENKNEEVKALLP